MTYTGLPPSLHALFNGDAIEERMNRAIGLDDFVERTGMAMISGIPNPAGFAGSSGQHQPVNPCIGKGVGAAIRPTDSAGFTSLPPL